MKSAEIKANDPCTCTKSIKEKILRKIIDEYVVTEWFSVQSIVR